MAEESPDYRVSKSNKLLDYFTPISKPIRQPDVILGDKPVFAFAFGLGAPIIPFRRGGQEGMIAGQNNNNLATLLELLTEAVALASDDFPSVAGQLRTLRQQLEETNDSLGGHCKKNRSSDVSSPTRAAAEHPGILLCQLIGDKASVAQVGHRIGVTRQAVNLLLNGKVKLTRNMAQRLESGGFIDSAEAWLARQKSFDAAQLPNRSPSNHRRSHRPMPR